MCTHLNSDTADVFTPASIAGASTQLRESILGIAKMSALLECVKLQQQIVEETQWQQREREARAARARVCAEMGTQHDKNKKIKTENPPKKPKQDPNLGADDEEEDLEEVLEEGTRK